MAAEVKRVSPHFRHNLKSKSLTRWRQSGVRDLNTRGKEENGLPL